VQLGVPTNELPNLAQVAVSGAKRSVQLIVSAGYSTETGTPKPQRLATFELEARKLLIFRMCGVRPAKWPDQHSCAESCLKHQVPVAGVDKSGLAIPTPILFCGYCRSIAFSVWLAALGKSHEHCESRSVRRESSREKISERVRVARLHEAFSFTPLRLGRADPSRQLS
jgi:hypothetical protein